MSGTKDMKGVGRKKLNRQYEILSATRAYKAEFGQSPSVRDLMFLTGIGSTSLVSFYLRRLESEGLIRTTGRISRSIEIIGGTNLSGSDYSAYAEKINKLKQMRETIRIDAKASYEETARKKSIAASKALRPRQRNLILFPDDESITSKTLNARIDAVVAKAQKSESGGYDVIRESRKLKLRASGTRIG